MEDLSAIINEEVLEMPIANSEEIGDCAIPGTGEDVVLHDGVDDCLVVVGDEFLGHWGWLAALAEELLIDGAIGIRKPQ